MELPFLTSNPSFPTTYLQFPDPQKIRNENIVRNLFGNNARYYGAIDNVVLDVLEHYVKPAIDNGNPKDFLIGHGYRAVRV